MGSSSNEQEIADIRRTFAMLAERVVRLERKVMGRPLMEVFAEDDENDEKGYHCELCRLIKNWSEPCSGLLDSCRCFECRTWREDRDRSRR